MDFIHWMGAAEPVAKLQLYFGLEIKLTDDQDAKKSDEVKCDEKPKDETKKKESLISSLIGPTLVGGSESDNAEANSGQNYTIHNKFWYHFFSFASLAGHELFYTLFFTFWFWNIDGAVARRVMVFWGMSMYIGQALKDILKVNRPACPPCVRLDSQWVLEYGLPSTHAAVALSIPGSLLIFSHERYQLWWWSSLCLVVFWCASVSVSRLYLGMHSILDIVCGLLYSGLLLLLVSPFLNTLDHFVLTQLFSPLALIGVTVGLVAVYPTTCNWNSARGDTAVILGVGCGALIGSWLNYQCGIIVPPPALGSASIQPYPIMWPDLFMTMLAIVRTLLGLVGLTLVRKYVRDMAMDTVFKSLQVSKEDYLTKQLSMDKHTLIECSYKLVTYAAIGFYIVTVAPCMFRVLGIERCTYATEV